MEALFGLGNSEHGSMGGGEIRASFPVLAPTPTSSLVLFSRLVADYLPSSPTSSLVDYLDYLPRLRRNHMDTTLPPLRKVRSDSQHESVHSYGDKRCTETPFMEPSHPPEVVKFKNMKLTFVVFL